MDETDGDGRFRIGGLSAMAYVISARIDERAAEKPLPAVAPGSTVEVALRLARRATLRARLVAGGQPVAGARVEALVPTEEHRVRALGSAVSQPDGRLVIAGLPRRMVRLKVEGYRLVDPKDLDVAAAAEREIDLACERLATVSGRVLRSGQPAGHATVILQTEHQGRDLRDETRADGRFRIEGVAPGPHTIGAEDGQTLSGQQPIVVGERDIDDVVLKIDLDASIAGTVVDLDGKPVAGVTVHFFCNTKRDSGTAVTGADGTFLVTSLAGGGDYRPWLSAEREGPSGYRPPAGQDWAPVSVPDGTSHITGVRLAIAVGELAIAGRVVRAGAPVPDVEIGADGERTGSTAPTHTDAAGAFTLTGLLAGSYTLRVGPMDHLIRVVRDIQAGARDVTIELPAVGAIEGTLDGFHGWPRVLATYQRAGEQEYHPPLQARVADGTFAFADVPIGSFVVTAIDTSGESATAEVTVAADAVARVTLAPEPRARVDGVVLSWPGRQPMSGMTCMWRIYGVAGRSGSETNSDADARFSIEVPAAQRVHVSCMGRPWESGNIKDAEVELAAGSSGSAEVLVYNLKPGHRPFWFPGLQLDPSGRVGADFSGLRAGDRILAVDGISIADVGAHAAMPMLLGDHDPGTTATLTVERDGVEQTIGLAIPDRFASPPGK